jgi:hypothetical protein
VPLVELGRRVALEMVDGRQVRPAGSLLYDKSGTQWPSCSVLIMPFAHAGRPAKQTPFAKQWFGSGYEVLAGDVNTPPKDLGQWREVGPASRVLFTRGGEEYPGDYEHPFGAAAGGFMRVLFPGSGKLNPGKKPILLHRPGAYRLELGSGCSVTRSGFVHP